MDQSYLPRWLAIIYIANVFSNVTAMLRTCHGHGAPAEFGTRRVRIKIRCRFQQFNHEYPHEI